MNILLDYFNTKENTAPFSKIKNEDFFPAFQKAIELAKAEIDAIVNNTENPTFQNVLRSIMRKFSNLPQLTSKLRQNNNVWCYSPCIHTPEAETHETCLHADVFFSFYFQNWSPMVKQFADDQERRHTPSRNLIYDNSYRIVSLFYKIIKN